MRYYPAFLDLTDKDILVIGGGMVAFRKILSLLKCGAKVSVVSPKVNSKIESLKNKNKINLYQRKFSPEDLKKKELVVCAVEKEAPSSFGTTHETLSSFVGRECKKRGIWVNIVDQPSLCSFIVPSVVQRGDVIFAISTGGSSPALAKFLRRKLEVAFGSEIGSLARILKKLRGKILKIPITRRRKILEKTLRDKTLKTIHEKGVSLFERHLENCLNAEY